jgi:hypothetical protein
MSITSPVDIVRNLQTDKLCKLKCMYQFNYKPTTLSITNIGSMIMWNVDEVAVPPVIYNDTNYTIESVLLIAPSIHTFNGNKTDAELLLFHTNTNFTKKLMVCVPIKVSSTATSECSTFFDLILGEVSQTAPAQGQRTIFNNATFSLNKFIPRTPYFSYTGSNILARMPGSQRGSAYTADIDYIVFHVDNAINMTTQALNILKRVAPLSNTLNISSISESQNPGGVFYNPNGPISDTGPNEIYIDCQPTGDDGELLVNVRQDTAVALDTAMLNKIMNSGFLKIIIGAFLMIVIWKITLKFIHGLAVNTSRLSGGSKLSGIRGGRGAK